MAQVWVSHLTGDAHQPTHCAAIALPGDPEKLDGVYDYVDVCSRIKPIKAPAQSDKIRHLSEIDRTLANVGGLPSRRC